MPENPLSRKTTRQVTRKTNNPPKRIEYEPLEKESIVNVGRSNDEFAHATDTELKDSNSQSIGGSPLKIISFCNNSDENAENDIVAHSKDSFVSVPKLSPSVFPKSKSFDVEFVETGKGSHESSSITMLFDNDSSDASQEDRMVEVQFGESMFRLQEIEQADPNWIPRKDSSASNLETISTKSIEDKELVVTEAYWQQVRCGRCESAGLHLFEVKGGSTYMTCEGKQNLMSNISQGEAITEPIDLNDTQSNNAETSLSTAQKYLNSTEQTTPESIKLSKDTNSPDGSDKEQAKKEPTVQRVFDLVKIVQNRSHEQAEVLRDLQDSLTVVEGKSRESGNLAKSLTGRVEKIENTNFYQVQNHDAVLNDLREVQSELYMPEGSVAKLKDAFNEKLLALEEVLKQMQYQIDSNTVEVHKAVELSSSVQKVLTEVQKCKHETAIQIADIKINLKNVENKPDNNHKISQLSGLFKTLAANLVISNLESVKEFDDFRREKHEEKEHYKKQFSVLSGLIKTLSRELQRFKDQNSVQISMINEQKAILEKIVEDTTPTSELLGVIQMLSTSLKQYQDGTFSQVAELKGAQEMHQTLMVQSDAQVCQLTEAMSAFKKDCLVEIERCKGVASVVEAFEERLERMEATKRCPKGTAEPPLERTEIIENANPTPKVQGTYPNEEGVGQETQSVQSIMAGALLGAVTLAAMMPKQTMQLGGIAMMSIAGFELFGHIQTHGSITMPKALGCAVILLGGVVVTNVFC